MSASSSDSAAVDTEVRAGARSLPELFASVAARRPGDEAVVDGEHTLSYAALDAASGRLAARLTRLGVGRGDLVGLLLDRSADIPVGILGTLRTGAAYVPLDPSYPQERLRYLAADAGLRVVVGDPATVREAGLTGVPVVEPTGAPGPKDIPPVPEISPEEPAYVIYTSGSTGNPKGCVVSHRNVLALLRAALPLFELAPTDRWALFHSFSFDVSVWEFWAAMATGATAVTVPLRTARSAPDLLELLIRQRITVLCQVPSVFRPLARAYPDAGRPELFLRYLVFAGEPVDLDVVRDFVEGYHGTPPVAVNMYGPTETTVYATHQVLRADDLAGPVRSPIGTALPHLIIEIRDERAELLPDGETGEMWITGTGVADGYLHRPGLTAERFVTLDGPGGPTRYYRTGDLARKRAGGSLEYLGRNDQQIKLRGYRIELGEVESVLRGHSLVREVAVTVVSTPAGAQFLLACLVLAGSAPEDAPDVIRQHALEMLPRYMVPDRYVTVAELPRTGSGKLDRAALGTLANLRRRRT